MKRGWLLNLALLSVVAALALFVWLKPARDELAQKPLSATRAAQVRDIRLLRPGKPAITLQRRDAQWRITAPLQARADDFQVLRLLTILDEQPAARLPATDLARFDLQRPVARLVIDGVEYAFGGLNAVTSEQYVLRGDAVYAVALRHGAAFPANPHALIHRALLEESEQPVAVRLPEFSIGKKDGGWFLQPPADARQEDLQRYIDQWRHASAAQAEPHDQRPALDEIQVTLRDGKILTFGILQREPQLLLWRRDNNLQYLFLAAAGQVLLTRPGAISSQSKNN